VEQLYEISAKAADVLLASALVIALLKFKQFSRTERWYVYYAMFVFCINMLLYIKFKGTHEYLYPIYIAGEFFLLASIYIRKLAVQKLFIIPIIIVSLLFLSISHIIPDYEDDYSKAVSNLAVVTLIACSMIYDLRKDSLKRKFTILDAVIFLYYTVSIFIFILQHQLIPYNPEHFYVIWSINNVLLVGLYFTILYTFIKLKK